jgi:hypothetical protein
MRMSQNAFGNGPKLVEVLTGIWFQKAGLKFVARYIALCAFVIDSVARRPLLIERQILRCLRNGHIKSLDDVRAIHAAFPIKSELDEFEPALHAPFQHHLASRHRSPPSRVR